MNKWALVLGAVGSLCMLFVLDSKSLLQSTNSNADQKELNYARNLDVHQLDLTLSPMKLEDWLRSGPTGIGKLNWRTSPTCDLQIPPPVSADKGDWATCVKFIFAYKGASKSPAYVEGLITVGTVRKGITGRPGSSTLGSWTTSFSSEIHPGNPISTTTNSLIFFAHSAISRGYSRRFKSTAPEILS